MAQTVKTIVVDVEKLTKHLVKSCPHYFYNFANGESCERKVDKGHCDLHVYSRELKCPLDCPRLDAREYSCDKERCLRIKALIKKFKVD